MRLRQLAPACGVLGRSVPRFHGPAATGAGRSEHERVAAVATIERIESLVLDWAELHQVELLEDWQLCQDMQNPKPIAPLE